MLLPAPAHFTESFLSLKFLNLSEKIAVMRGISAIQSQYQRRTDLDRITMLDWLKEQRQPPRAIERFWRQIMVSAISEELDAHGGRARIPGVPAGAAGAPGLLSDGRAHGSAGELYGLEKWKKSRGASNSTCGRPWSGS